MSSHKMLQQAIELMQSGNKTAGGRMLQAVINDPNLPNNFRATAYAWLAESQDDLNFKINCLNRALDSDPTNKQIQDRLNGLLAVQPPNPNQVTQRPQPPQNPVTHIGGFALPNAELPDSQPINVIKPNMSDSQPMRPVDLSPPTDPRAPYQPNTPQAHDPSAGANQYPPNHLPSLNQQGAGWTTNSQPTINRPNNLSDSQPMMPTNLPNQAGVPPQMAPRQNQPTYRLQQTPPVIAILDGPNEAGTGVFVTTDGIIATTRYVVGGSEQVMIDAGVGQHIPARVIRTYPEYDLALLQANITLEQVWTATQVPVVSDNEPFTVLSANGASQRGFRRKSKSQLPNHWIPTSIDTRQVPDAGGDGLFDANNYLIGILTRNASRETGLTYGLHIVHIYALVSQFIRDRQQVPNAGYCYGCGNITRAHLYGGYYCETCGTVLQSAGDTRRLQTSPQLAQIYNENLSRTCPNCSARVGYHNGKCLRCSYDLDSGRNI